MPQLACPRCARKMEVAAEKAGRMHQCAACGWIFKAPPAAAAAAAPAARVMPHPTAVRTMAAIRTLNQKAGGAGATAATPLVPTPKLTEADLPPPDASAEQLAAFARSFNGFVYSRRCGQIAAAARGSYLAGGQLPPGLTTDDLRACLFFEHHELAQAGKRPSAAGLQYFRTIVERTRDHVRGRRAG